MKFCRSAWLLVVVVAGCHSESWRSNPSVEDIPTLIQELKEADEPTRIAAAESLGHLGADAKSALPALVLALRDEGESLRQSAIRAIIAIGPDVRSMNDLSVSLKDSDNTVRAMSATALGQLGPVARQTIPALRLALQDTDEAVQKEASEALMRIDPASAPR
jgi:HEAT repeat protein